MKTKISWREKVDKISEPVMVDVPERMQKRFGKGKMLIPRPLDIERLINSVRKGKLITKAELRLKLAEESGADVTCPLTTGIFLRIVSEAAEEDLNAGKKKITPYWRVIGDKGELNEKIAGGTELQRRRLLSEGFQIERAARGGKYFVKDFGKKLIRQQQG